jgi:uncharacterized protein
MMKKTLVLGASDNPERYSYLAIKRLIAHQMPVVAVGRKQAEVAGVTIHESPQPFSDIDTVTIYLQAKNQVAYYDYLFSLAPKRLIFNPGAENDELSDLARARGIEVMDACTLVMLQTGQY